jgi:Cu2+-exporting ATPase
MDHSGHQHHDSNSQDHGSHHEGMLRDFRQRFWISLLLTLPILVLSPTIQSLVGMGGAITFRGQLYVLFGISTIIFFYGGWPFLKGAVDELLDLNPGMMTLIGLAILVAYGYSSMVAWGFPGKVFFWELVTLIDIMLVGHWIEMRSVMSASKALDKLAELMPEQATRIKEDGSSEIVNLNELNKDDRLLVKPGETIPADGIIVEGQTSVNESLVTGESKPVEKELEDEVIGGSVNQNGSITIKVTQTGEDSFLSQVMRLVEEAQESKSRTQNLADRAAFWLTIIALSAGLLTFLGWNYYSSQDLVFALERTVTVMVITCPHALGLAIPLVVSVSTSIAANHGFLIRNRTAFEQAREIEAVIFDKTGTLTEGNFGVTDILSLHEAWKEDQVLKYAASIEQKSEHPLGEGIVNAAEDYFGAQNVEAITGKGIKGSANGRSVYVVSPGYLDEQGIDRPESEKLEQLSSQGRTIVYVLVDDELIGAIALGDQIRDESYTAMQRLKEAGIQVMMLTGDNRHVAQYVAKELQMDDAFAEVLPDAKSDKVKEVQQRGLTVAMVGDGVNDAPALAQADVGIAIGAGSDVAVETADLILVKNNPNDVPSILMLAQATYRKMIQNLWWATGYNVVAIPLAAGVLFSYGVILSPAMGAILMSASTVIAAANARLLKIQ